MSNWFMSWLLRSRFHRLISSNILLISYTGRRSGKEYSTPVNYLKDGNYLWISSLRTRTWWRNFREVWPIRVLIQGKDIQGKGEAITNQDALVEAFQNFFQLSPSSAKYYNIKLDESGLAGKDDLEIIAIERILVRVEIQY